MKFSVKLETQLLRSQKRSRTRPPAYSRGYSCRLNIFLFFVICTQSIDSHERIVLHGEKTSETIPTERVIVQAQ